jgi:chemotaxis protein methyltransferase CheR
MELSPKTFQELASRIQQLCGLDLGPHKLYLVRNRLEPIIRQRNLTGFDDLARRLATPDLTLRREVVEAITTHETAFFRDGHPFETFRTRLLPRFVEEALRRGGPVRIWSAACSTGQEAYSLAMILREWKPAPAQRAPSFMLVATDISPAALARAGAGEYAAWETARGLTETQLRTHFEPCAGGHRVVPEVRKLVQFRIHNLLDPVAPPPGLFDLISCRNVLIYFDEPTRVRVVRRFHEVLSPGGVLLLGAAENLLGSEDGWATELLGATLVYRKS